MVPTLCIFVCMKVCSILITAWLVSACALAVHFVNPQCGYVAVDITCSSGNMVVCLLRSCLDLLESPLPWPVRGTVIIYCQKLHLLSSIVPDSSHDLQAKVISVLLVTVPWFVLDWFLQNVSWRGVTCIILDHYMSCMLLTVLQHWVRGEEAFSFPSVLPKES